MQPISAKKMERHNHYSLLARNTFGIDARAEAFVEYGTVEELRQLLSGKEALPLPFLHIGAGSNLLFVSDFEGTVFHSAIKGIDVVGETEDSVCLRVGAGELWDDFVSVCVRRGWHGVENLSLIPGEVGAAAVQNIGAYGVEAKDVIGKVHAVEIRTGRRKVFLNRDCRYSYRQSIFKGEQKGKYAVTHVDFTLQKAGAFRLDYGNLRDELRKYPEVNLENVRRAVIAIREAKLPDPKVTGNAGSFFMNPVVPADVYGRLRQEYPDMPCYPADGGCVKLPAAWLIDRCGWKGKTVGRAGVHDRQALVLVNRGGASGRDIVRLSEEICRSVQEKFGIGLRPEVNFIGG